MKKSNKKTLEKLQKLRDNNEKRALENGITLVALVVTIVVLLILSGVTISALFGDNGIISAAQKASNETKDAVNTTEKELQNLAKDLNKVLTPKKEEKLVADGSFSNKKGVNTPKLGTGMTAIKWNDKTKQWDETTADDENWYDYINKKWANAKTTDGSMWVWIPRYAYQIESNWHNGGENISGTINIEFLKGTTNETASGTTRTWNNASGQGNWNIHPAFYYGDSSNKEENAVSGIWVAKFEASQSDAGANAADYQNSTGGTSGIIKIQPGVNSWRNISNNDIYNKCLNYNTALNSHMMKNSEWGACSYLAQSTYGKNSEVGVNQCKQFITGAGPGDSADVVGTAYDYNASTFNTNYSYTTAQGQKASTTGNITGIYDMSGGSWERVAAYVNNGNDNLTTYGNSLVNGAIKTKDVYIKGTTDDQAGNYAASAGVYGDAVYETSSNINGSYSWYNDYSAFPSAGSPFFVRGGHWYDGIYAGLFTFNDYYGYSYTCYGFRPVLVAL